MTDKKLLKDHPQMDHKKPLAEEWREAQEEYARYLEEKKKDTK